MYDLMGNREQEQNINVVTRVNKKGVTVTKENRQSWQYEINNLNQYTNILTPQELANTGSTDTGSTDTGSTDTGSTDT